MKLLLEFGPFIVFALVDRMIGHVEGLIVGGIVSPVQIARELACGGRIKIREAGSAILFGGLALYAFALRPDWSIMEVRLRVDLGLPGGSADIVSGGAPLHSSVCIGGR